MDTIEIIASKFVSWHGRMGHMYPEATANVLLDATEAEWAAWADIAGVPTPMDPIVRLAIVVAVERKFQDH